MRASWILAWALLNGAAGLAEESTFKAGVARVVITPSEPMWLAGYAARDRPAEGAEHDLYAKALALEGPDGRGVVLLTSDLLSFAREFSQEVARRVEQATGLSRDRLMLTASHTHCGPVIADNLLGMYPLPDDMRRKSLAYTEKLKDQIVDVVVRAWRERQPAMLHHGQGTARFAVNRRRVTPQGVIGGANPDGPVDHSVPVLRIADRHGKLLAVVFGYACHNTTLQYYKWCGDYAGFAQVELEERYPGVTAMFWAGCGGDVNPLPRSTVELCRKYGKELAVAVHEVLGSPMTEIRGPIVARYEEIALPFAATPSEERLRAEAKDSYPARRHRAQRYLQLLAEGKSIPTEYPHFPVQVWHLGDVCWIALGGEVVVDYARRLKRELGNDRPVWVTAYANDVMAYIPSERVLAEGGYEGETSMTEYGLPSKWKTGIEDKIIGTSLRLARAMPAR